MPTLKHHIYNPKRRKRTKRAYAELFDNPGLMFGPHAQVTLFPNGQHEIWIKSQLGTFRITAGNGPAGFGITVSSAVGDPLTVAGVTDRKTYSETQHDDVWEVRLTQPHADAYSQQFARWYACDAKDDDGNKREPHPDVLGLVPTHGPNGAVLAQG